MRRIVCRVFGALTGVGAIVLLATQAAAQTPPPLFVERPLVLPFSVVVDGDVPGGEGAGFWLGEAAALLLAEEFDARGLAVFSRAERVAAFASLQLPVTVPLTRATMIRVGELVGATELVVGEIRLGNRLTVTARIITLESARERAQARADGAGTEIYEVIEQIASRLAPTTGNVRHVDTRLPLGAFENYVKGLVATTPAVQERFLEAARQQVPTDDRILLAVWEFQMSQAAHEKALIAVRSVRRDARLDRQARYAAALSLIELRRYDEAYQQLQALHGEQPSPVLSNAIGVIQVRRGSTPETGLPTYFFTRAVDEAPDQPEFLFNLGYAYARSKNPDAALYWLREVVRFDPADGDAHLVMSQMLMAGGKKVEAQRELDLARQLGTTVDAATLTLADRVPTGLERLTSRLEVRHMTNVAAAVANPAQREQQELAAFHLARGRRLFEQEDDRGATNELRRAIYLRPYDDEPHLLLGQIYRRAGRLAEAIDAFRIAVWSRESVVARMRLAEALHDHGETTLAIAEAKRAVALDPQSLQARELLARLGGGDGVRSSGPHD
jgi:predicted Zn-dependent protease